MASEKPKAAEPAPDSPKPPKPRPLAPLAWAAALLLAFSLLMLAQQATSQTEEITYTTFERQVRAGNVASAVVERELVSGVFRERPPRPRRDRPESATQEARTDSRPGGAASPADGATSAASATATEDSAATGAGKASAGSDRDSAPPRPAAARSDGDATNGDAASGKGAADGATGDQASNDPGAKKTDNPDLLPERFTVTVQGGVDEELRSLLLDNGVELRFRTPQDWGWVFPLLSLLLVVGVVVVMFGMFRRTRDQMMGGGMLGGVTRSTAKRYEPESGPKITFDDVAGLKSVKRDLKEIVEYLREPEKFQKLGARVPKGVLLNGPPGTGKTLLAKAVAGEAGAPFFSINGSEFIQMFVGVGASRVRDMFKTAKKSAPSILFIDEIDAVGRQRGAGLGGGHDEREQTLNQILSEMDGFTPSETVIVVAATNRPDVLDPALLRPGRFDRHITVDRPSVEGRQQLFEVHTRKVPIGDDVDLDRLAKATSGLTGADIANLVNEAALWATRHDRRFVTMEDFEYARDKALMGATRDEVLGEHERKVTAYHEAGHALVAWLLPDCDRVHKVTIIPRGRALGVTQLVPDEDRHNVSRAELNARLAMALGGRAAEKLVLDEYTVGASSDLERATKLARRMVTHWGMSDRLGPVALHNGGDDPFLGREIVQEQKHYSEHTAQLIDDEVSKVLHAADDRARQLLSEHRDKLQAIAGALLEHEEIGDTLIAKLIGPSAQTERTQHAPPIEIAPPAPSPTPAQTRGRG